MNKKTFTMHLMGLVHLPSAKKYLSCAFTQKNLKLAKMLTSLGHEVYFYGARSTEEELIENYIGSDKFHFVETHTVEDIAKSWGEGNNLHETGYDFTKMDFKHDFSGEKKPATLKFYKNAIEHINKVKKPDDFFLNTMGYYYRPVSDAINLYLDLESGIGYRGSYEGTKEKPHFRAFESAFIRDFTYGGFHPFADMNGNFYDRIIGNYFDLDDFEFRDKKDDYYLYIGRMISRKGIEVAVQTCNHLGKKLIIAGQGAKVQPNGHLTSGDFDFAPGTWEYFGFAGVEDRKRLMAGAKAMFVPTLYQEIFGGTHIEAMLSATPPIVTNFGVFNGTIPDFLNGVVGFRCNTLKDFCEAALAAEHVDHAFIRKYGERYSMDRIALDFQRWFEDLYQLYLSTKGEKGWSYIPKVLDKNRKVW